MKRDNEEMGKDIQNAQKIFHQASQITNPYYYQKALMDSNLPMYENLQSMELFKKMHLMPAALAATKREAL